MPTVFCGFKKEINTSIDSREQKKCVKPRFEAGKVVRKERDDILLEDSKGGRCKNVHGAKC